jgi:two-component system sensor histidine kinase UhpB
MVIQIEELKISKPGETTALAELSGLQDSTREVLQSLRAILGQMVDQPVFETSFVPSIRAFLDRVELQTGIVADVIVEDWPDQLNPTAATNLYRLVEHAVRNAVGHANARRVIVALRRAGDYGTVAITDNGTGMDVAAADGAGGYGLRGMRERAVLVGGDMLIASAPLVGTVVTVTVPLARLT